MDYKATNTDEFIAELKARLADNADCGVTHYNLGTAYVAQGRLIEAEAELLRAIECSPTMAEAYVQLGGLAMNKGDLDRCLEMNEKAATHWPHFAVPYGNMGFVFMQKGELDKAEKALKRAIKLDPKFLQALATMASLKYMQGDLDGAADMSQKALTAQPQFGPAYNNLALVAFERGDAKAARELLDKAIATGFEPHPDFVRDVNAKL